MSGNPDYQKRVEQDVGAGHQAAYPEKMKGEYGHPPPAPQGIESASQTETPKIHPSGLLVMQATQAARLQKGSSRGKKGKS